MVFNLSQDFYLIILIVLAIWLSLLSFFLYRATSHYSHLTRGVANQDLKTVLEKILAKADLAQEKIGELQKQSEKLEEEGRLHIKKIGLLRFNPFKDTGGNQSFVLALLDENGSGLVLSSLYTRTGNRWYIKTIKEEKGVDSELSKEEREAIKKAQA